MIYIDVSAAAHNRAGLGRYSERLARAVIEEQPERFALFYNEGPEAKVPESLANISARSIGQGYKPWRMAILLAQLSRISFKRLVPDAHLFHSTEHLLMPLRGVPTVLTVHDLIYKLYPAYHKKLNYWYLNLAMPLFCKRASAIIAVSQATKRDIVKYYGIDPAKITVIYEAASSKFRVPEQSEVARVKQIYDLPEKYLIHLSTIEPRKNLNRLLDAVLILREAHPELQLVLVGGKGWLYDDFFQRINQEGLEDIVHHLGWVSDDDLVGVIAGATLAVHPSLYEGFGLPILEHMACGQVVAASDSSSLPEIGGDAAAYFNPNDISDMAAVIGRLLTDQAEYDRRRELGLIQEKRFNWQTAATETIALYDKLLK